MSKSYTKELPVVRQDCEILVEENVLARFNLFCISLYILNQNGRSHKSCTISYILFFHIKIMALLLCMYVHIYVKKRQKRLENVICPNKLPFITRIENSFFFYKKLRLKPFSNIKGSSLGF